MNVVNGIAPLPLWERVGVRGPFSLPQCRFRTGQNHPPCLKLTPMGESRDPAMPVSKFTVSLSLSKGLASALAQKPFDKLRDTDGVLPAPELGSDFRRDDN